MGPGKASRERAGGSVTLKMPPQSTGLLRRQVPMTPWPLLSAGSACGPGPAGSDQAEGWKCSRRCWLPAWTLGSRGSGGGGLTGAPPPANIPHLFRGRRSPPPALGAEPDPPKEHASGAQGGQLPARLPGPAYRVMVPHGAFAHSRSRAWKCRAPGCPPKR